MEKYDITIVSPGGNITALIKGIPGKKEKQQVNNKKFFIQD